MSAQLDAAIGDPYYTASIPADDSGGAWSSFLGQTGALATGALSRLVDIELTRRAASVAPAVKTAQSDLRNGPTGGLGAIVGSSQFGWLAVGLLAAGVAYLVVKG